MGDVIDYELGAEAIVAATGASLTELEQCYLGALAWSQETFAAAAE